MGMMRQGMPRPPRINGTPTQGYAGDPRAMSGQRTMSGGGLGMNPGGSFDFSGSGQPVQGLGQMGQTAMMSTQPGGMPQAPRISGTPTQGYAGDPRAMSGRGQMLARVLGGMF